VERLARNEFLGNLPFEFDAMGTVLGHLKDRRKFTKRSPIKEIEIWKLPELCEARRTRKFTKRSPRPWC
jgi:hypothetical protein